MIRKIRKYLDDPNQDFQYKSFILLSLIALVALFFAVVSGILIGQSFSANASVAAEFILFSVVFFGAIWFSKLHAAMVFISFVLVFVFLPITFFTSGGAAGGTPVWFAFSTLYVVMILSGRTKVFLLISESIMIVVCWWLGYTHPEMVTEFTREDAYVDSIATLFIVGAVMTILLNYQTILFRRENARVRNQKKEIENLNRSQNHFFSSMSHEIRTPINSILGLNEVILRQQDASEEIRRDAANIQGAGRMLLALINDILDFSKIEAGKMDIVPVDYKVGDMMSEIVNMVWLRAHEKGIGFQVDIDPNVPSVLFGDEVRIKQIIINLLNNAVKYTQAGSVGLHIESEKVGDDQVRLLISVSDTGMGIKQEAMPHLFDAFKRADQEKNRHIEGTGLGLSIVRQLVDLMGGEITVNSVYGQGSTFSVSLLQEVSDTTVLGNMNISEQGAAGKKYEHMFKAPEAHILIVDDNEMNLEVEQKLLTGTQIGISTAMSGADALRLSLEQRFDVILMDHLMPEMDGIECLAEIRSQTGGLNADVPVVVLTANAGAENRELYSASGFDGYLVKPVSGRQLEETLLKYIPREKLIINESAQMNAGAVHTAAGYRRKQAVAFAAGSLCDLPEVLIRSLGINILPHSVLTDEGAFRDNVEMSADETVRYMDTGRDAKGIPPEIFDYVEFFSRLLRGAHHVIYIALTPGISEDHARAMAAASSFENVTVINSECVSSNLGLLLLIGCKLAQQNQPVDRIVEELALAKTRMHSSFVLGTTEYMTRKGLVNARMNRIIHSMDLHPEIVFKKDRYKVGGVWMGSTERCYDGYIRRSLPRMANPDPEILFVTYVDIPEEELIRIEEQIRKRAHFDHIIFQQASAVITSTAGPGALALLYMKKGPRSYSLSSLLPADLGQGEGDSDADGELLPAVPEFGLPDGGDDQTAVTAREGNFDGGDSRREETEAEVSRPEPAQKQWYEELTGIDGEAGVRNSGSEDGFRTVLKLFYNSIDAKASEIRGYYEAQDWQNYTIKVHALKSSARLIGALELSAEAESLEAAGKAGETAYIREHHDAMMQHFVGYQESLAPLFDEAEAVAAGMANAEAAATGTPDATPAAAGMPDAKSAAPAKPEADAGLLSMALEEIRAAAEAKDPGRFDNLFADLEDYSLPEEQAGRFEKILEAAAAEDYDRILTILGSS